MAKARKAKRSSKKTKRRVKVKKGAKRTPRRAKARKAKTKKKGGIAGVAQSVIDTVKEAAGLRSRLAGHDTFED